MSFIFVKKKKTPENYYYPLASFCHFHLVPSRPSVSTAIARSPKSGDNFGADMRERGRKGQTGGGGGKRGTEISRRSYLDPCGGPFSSLSPLFSPSSDPTRQPPTTMARACVPRSRVREERFLFFLSWLYEERERRDRILRL